MSIFLRRNSGRIKIKNSGGIIQIYITEYPTDLAYEMSIQYMMEYLCSIVGDKKVYIEIYGDETKFITEDLTVKRVIDNKHIYRRKLYVKSEWLNRYKQELFEEEHISIYIANLQWSWNDFVRTPCIANMKPYIKKGLITATVELGAFQTLMICQDAKYELKAYQFLQKMKEQGYIIKGGL